MQPGWIDADWPAPDGIVAGSSTRVGGHSNGPYDSLNLGAHVGDTPENVLANRETLSDALQLPSQPCWLNQVHGVAVVQASDLSNPTADASVGQPGEVCCIMTADCLPVLLCSREGQVVAAAHGGWRGLAEGILFRTVAAMQREPGDIMAWLGPAIAQDAFEVGSEVREAFVTGYTGAAAHFKRNEAGRWQADLYGIARLQLELAGVTQVYGGGFCTYDDKARFFSYRRDGQCGRMASIICLKTAS